MSSAYGHLLAYPLACFALRLVLGWTAPVWRVAAAPLLWLLRRAVWEPTWWVCAPLAGACYVAADAAEKRPSIVHPGLWLQAVVTVIAWWVPPGRRCLALGTGAFVH